MTQKKLTILLPNYKTPKLVKLCLRLLKKHTDMSQVHVIVIDNDSQDESLDYLRGLDWVELIERKAQSDDTGELSHRRALDLGLERVRTPYFISIHTDTLMTHPGWLSVLLKEIEGKPEVGGVGSWKLEAKPAWRTALKKLEGAGQRLFSRISGRQHRVVGKDGNYYFLRSHCALYRKDLFDQLNLRFGDGSGCAGKLVHKALVDAGFKMVFLPSDYLGRYMDHLNHATLILNPEREGLKTANAKDYRDMQRKLKALQADAILADSTLD